MYIFLSDETNTTQTAGVLFMIYGAIVMPMENAATAVEQVIAIRQTAGSSAGNDAWSISATRISRIS